MAVDARKLEAVACSVSAAALETVNAFAAVAEDRYGDHTHTHGRMHKCISGCRAPRVRNAADKTTRAYPRQMDPLVGDAVSR